MFQRADLQDVNAAVFDARAVLIIDGDGAALDLCEIEFRRIKRDCIFQADAIARAFRGRCKGRCRSSG